MAKIRSLNKHNSTEMFSRQNQGDRIGQLFFLIGQLLKVDCIFVNTNSPAKWQPATFWDYFYTFCNFLHFHLNEEFQDRFYEGILRFQKWCDEDVLDFNPRFDVEVLAFFGLATLLITFCTIWANF